MYSTTDDPCLASSLRTTPIAYTRTTLASSPATLTAGNLPGATLAVTLGSPASTLTATPALTTFGSGVSASSFALDTSPTVTGLSISNASATNGSRTATLTLAYTGALSSNVTLRVWALAVGHSGSAAITSKALMVLGSREIVLSRTTLNMTEESSGTYGMGLNQQPTCNVVVSVSSSGNSAARAAPASRTFSTTNWNTA